MNGRTYPPGVPCWIDTTQPDIDAAANFYAGLFGWTFKDAAPGGGADGYLVAQLDGADVAGIAGGREDATAWSTYIAVEDADAAVDRLVAAGAVLRAPATDAGEDGRSAALADPEGMATTLKRPSIRRSGHGSPSSRLRRASRTPSPGSCPLEPAGRRTGMSRSLSPTGTGRPLMPSVLAGGS